MVVGLFSDAFPTTLVVGLIVLYEMIVNDEILEEIAKPEEQTFQESVSID